MMNDLKTGLKMMRYAYGIKLSCVQIAAFALLGIVYGIIEKNGNFGMLGGLFWICVGIVPSQLFYSLNVAKMVQASPLKKKMQTIVPVMLNLVSMLLVYLLEILICGIVSHVSPEQAARMGRSLILLTVMMVLVMVYLGICYKHFILSTLCLVPGTVFWMHGGLENWTYAFFFGEKDIPLGLAVPMGFGLILAGGLAEYLLTLLFYKAPLAKMAQYVPLRKEL